MSNFNFFSLDYIYYPVSAIMWVWYKVFAFLIGLIPGVNGETSFYSWALSVVFLVFTLRAILYRPFVRQIETTRQMQELQPQIKALQKKYGKDRQRMALEMQKLQKEHGFNPILGCLPMLAQVPVFLGLFHVLRSFNRTGHNFGELGLDPVQNMQLSNYVFSATDVQHFLQANLFGAPLGATMIQSESSWQAFIGFDVSRAAIIGVGVPLMIIAGIATHFNSRASVARQSPEAAANPQTAMMNKLALYVFPLGVVVGGPFLPLAIILYWVANNVWTYGQQHYVFGKIEAREEADKARQQAERRKNAPVGGSRPKWPRNYDPTAEVRKAYAQRDQGQIDTSVNTLIKAWDYLQGPGAAVRLKRTDGHDEEGPGGLVCEIAGELMGSLRSNGYLNHAFAVADRAGLAALAQNEEAPSYRELGTYFYFRGAALNIALQEKDWHVAASNGIEDMKWLDRWESIEVPAEVPEEFRGADSRSMNRFMWNFRVAEAVYQQKKFDDARPFARAALDVMSTWTEETRGERRAMLSSANGYHPSAAFDEALLLLILSARSDGGWRARFEGWRLRKARAKDAVRAVRLLAAEFDEAKANPDATEKDVAWVKQFYDGALQRVANLYLRYAMKVLSGEVLDQVSSAATDGAVDLLSTALDDEGDTALQDAAEARQASADANELAAPIDEALDRRAVKTAASRANVSGTTRKRSGKQANKGGRRN